MGWKEQLLKNTRNYAKYLEKKARGPVKAFFHITKNENVPAIEQQGLLTNHPNANINSANHPFRKHGTDAGGVWVTTEPTAFPVYGTTIGGKNGNSAARADALSTIKIEVPLPELRKMKAVQDPYGKNILRKGDDPRAVEKFGTWAGIDVPTTVLLNDVKPQWLKNIGYVEEAPKVGGSPKLPDLVDVPSGWGIPRNHAVFNILHWLGKGDFKEFVGYTGHRHGLGGYDRAQRRFVDEYLDVNQPITNRLPEFPKSYPLEIAARKQGAYFGPKYVQRGMAEVPAPNEANRYSVDFIPANTWTNEYRDYAKPGESYSKKRQFEFAPGAISRGMGGSPSTAKFTTAIRDRNFSWPIYKQQIAKGATPYDAARNAAPDYVLDWDNIVYHNTRGYVPEHIPINDVSTGAISRGMDYPDQKSIRANRLAASIFLKNAKADAAKYLTSELGRRPTAEEIDNWARIGLVNRIEGFNADVPPVVSDWAYKYNEDIIERLTHELGGD